MNKHNFQPDNKKCVNPECEGKPQDVDLESLGLRIDNNSINSKWFQCGGCGICSAWDLGWSGAAAMWDELYEMCNPGEPKPDEPQPAGWIANAPETVGKRVGNPLGCECRDEKCSYCHPCPDCKGEGFTMEDSGGQEPSGQWIEVERPCEYCRATGVKPEPVGCKCGAGQACDYCRVAKMEARKCRGTCGQIRPEGETGPHEFWFDHDEEKMSARVTCLGVKPEPVVDCDCNGANRDSCAFCVVKPEDTESNKNIFDKMIQGAHDEIRTLEIEIERLIIGRNALDEIPF
jgi:hypothetical protein